MPALKAIGAVQSDTILLVVAERQIGIVFEYTGSEARELHVAVSW